MGRQGPGLHAGWAHCHPSSEECSRSRDASSAIRVRFSPRAVVGGISQTTAVDAVVHDVCNRLLVPPQFTRPCGEILEWMKLASGWCDVEEEPLPQAEGLLRQNHSNDSCGNECEVPSLPRVGREPVGVSTYADVPVRIQ